MRRAFLSRGVLEMPLVHPSAAHEISVKSPEQFPRAAFWQQKAALQESPDPNPIQQQ